MLEVTIKFDVAKPEDIRRFMAVIAAESSRLAAAKAIDEAAVSPGSAPETQERSSAPAAAATAAPPAQAAKPSPEREPEPEVQPEVPAPASAKQDGNRTFDPTALFNKAGEAEKSEKPEPVQETQTDDAEPVELPPTAELPATFNPADLTPFEGMTLVKEVVVYLKGLGMDNAQVHAAAQRLQAAELPFLVRAGDKLRKRVDTALQIIGG